MPPPSQEGLPVIQLTAIELQLEHLDEGQRSFKDDVNRRFTEVSKRIDDFKVDADKYFDTVDKRFDAVDRRFDKLDARVKGTTDHLTRMLGLYAAIITLAVILSQLIIP